MRKAKRRQAPTDCSREIVFEQQATLSRLRAEVECALREGESLTSIAQVRFQYIMQCLPLTQKYLFEKDDPQKTTEQNLLGNIFNMVSYASASALRIHRPLRETPGRALPRQTMSTKIITVGTLTFLLLLYSLQAGTFHCNNDMFMLAANTKPKHASERQPFTAIFASSGSCRAGGYHTVKLTSSTLTMIVHPFHIVN